MGPQTTQLSLKPFVDVDDTVKSIFQVIGEEWHKDYLKPFDNWDLKKIFNYIKDLPYVDDPKNDALSGYDDIELIKTPFLTNYNGGDCDDKNVFLCSILKRQGIPYRFAVTSTTPEENLHHIYPEIFIDGYWMPFDATYNYNTPFTEAEFTKKRIYDDNCGVIVSYEIKQNSPITHTTKENCLPGMMKDAPGVKRNITLSGAGTIGKPAHMLLGHTGASHQLLGRSAGLGILRGKADTYYQWPRYPDTPVKKPCCSSCAQKTEVKSLLQQINDFPITHFLPMLLGREYLGVIPIAAVVAALPAITSWLSGLFGGGHPQYVDASQAYMSFANDRDNVFHQYPDVLHSDDAINKLVADRSALAVLLTEVMNPPLGADLCTPAGDSYYCGNRAKWADVKDMVQQKATQLLPYMAWVHYMDRDGTLPPSYQTPHYDSDQGMVNVYKDFKNHTGPYNQYLATAGTVTNNGTPLNPTLVNHQTGQYTSSIGGLSLTSILLYGGIAYGIYYVATSKKKRGSK